MLALKKIASGHIMSVRSIIKCRDSGVMKGRHSVCFKLSIGCIYLTFLYWLYNQSLDLKI